MDHLQAYVHISSGGAVIVRRIEDMVEVAGSFGKVPVSWKLRCVGKAMEISYLQRLRRASTPPCNDRGWSKIFTSTTWHSFQLSLKTVTRNLYQSGILLTMFYDGDLQSGIALALKDSKSVACFVKGPPISYLTWIHPLTACISCRGR